MPKTESISPLAAEGRTARRAWSFKPCTQANFHFAGA